MRVHMFVRTRGCACVCVCGEGRAGSVPNEVGGAMCRHFNEVVLESRAVITHTWTEVSSGHKVDFN